MTIFSHEMFRLDDPRQIDQVFAFGPAAIGTIPKGILAECVSLNRPETLRALLRNGYTDGWPVALGIAEKANHDPNVGIEELFTEFGICLDQDFQDSLGYENPDVTRRLLTAGHSHCSPDVIYSMFGRDLCKSFLLIGQSRVDMSSFGDHAPEVNALLALAFLHQADRFPKDRHQAVQYLSASTEIAVPGTEMFRTFNAYSAAHAFVESRDLALEHLQKVFPSTSSGADFPILLLPTLLKGAEWADFLLAAGLPVNLRDEQGDGLFEIAIRRGDALAARKYHQAGAVPIGLFDDYQEYGFAGRPIGRMVPLLLQVADTASYADLLSEFPFLTSERSRDGGTVLMRALQIGSPCTKMLIDLDVDVTATDRAGWTALHHAVHGISTAISFPGHVEGILKLGADVSATDRMGRTALDVMDSLRNTGDPLQNRSRQFDEVHARIEAAARQRRLSGSMSSTVQNLSTRARCADVI